MQIFAAGWLAKGLHFEDVPERGGGGGGRQWKDGLENEEGEKKKTVNDREKE